MQASKIDTFGTARRYIAMLALENVVSFING